MAMSFAKKITPEALQLVRLDTMPTSVKSSFCTIMKFTKGGLKHERPSCLRFGCDQDELREVCFLKIASVRTWMELSAGESACQLPHLNLLRFS